MIQNSEINAVTFKCEPKLISYVIQTKNFKKYFKCEICDNTNCGQKKEE